MTKITESRTRDILHWLDDRLAEPDLPYQAMALLRDAAALIRQLQAAEQAAWHAGLDEGREQGKGNEHCQAEPQPEETVDAEAWIEVLELPEGFRIAEHLPGIWEYQFVIEDEADEDSDCTVSGTSWNHPALAAIAAWSHAYDTLANQPPSAPVGVEGLMQLAREWCLAWGEWAHDADPGCAKENAAEAALRAALTTALAQQPEAVDEAMVERATMALLGKSHDTAPGIDWRCDRAWTVNKVRKNMRAALTAALAQQPEAVDGEEGK